MKLKTLAIISLVFFIASCGNDTEVKENTYKYTYETVENDPLNTLIYTLDNGLKVYMSINRDEPRIQTNIAVNTGSKQDPADAAFARRAGRVLFRPGFAAASIAFLIHEFVRRPL